MPGDLVIRVGQVGKEMFFLSKGCLAVLPKVKNVEDKAILMEEAAYFGEIALISRCVRNASVQAMTWVNLFCLTKNDFDQVLGNYPHIAKKLRHNAIKRDIQTTLVTNANWSDQMVVTSVCSKYRGVLVGTTNDNTDRAIAEECICTMMDAVEESGKEENQEKRRTPERPPTNMTSQRRASLLIDGNVWESEGKCAEDVARACTQAKKRASAGIASADQAKLASELAGIIPSVENLLLQNCEALKELKKMLCEGDVVSPEVKAAFRCVS
jgi:hypothetical protein